MASSEGDPLELDLLAASLRTDSDDLGTFIESLAVKLEQALPGLTRVQRGRRGLVGAKEVRAISVQSGDQQLELIRDGGNRVQARRARVSGGIVLKTETIDIDSWMEALTALLAAEAAHNERTRQALARLLLD
jgi:hypothetical protein